jgi:hypothetical protein
MGRRKLLQVEVEVEMSVLTETSSEFSSWFFASCAISIGISHLSSPATLKLQGKNRQKDFKLCARFSSQSLYHSCNLLCRFQAVLNQRLCSNSESATHSTCCCLRSLLYTASRVLFILHSLYF